MNIKILTWSIFHHVQVTTKRPWPCVWVSPTSSLTLMTTPRLVGEWHFTNPKQAYGLGGVTLLKQSNDPMYSIIQIRTSKQAAYSSIINSKTHYWIQVIVCHFLDGVGLHLCNLGITLTSQLIHLPRRFVKVWLIVILRMSWGNVLYVKCDDMYQTCICNR